MKKYIVLISILLTSMLSLKAEILSPDETLKRITFNGLAQRMPGKNEKFELSHIIYDSSEKPSIYIFNHRGDNGFIIAPADDEICPVLGYSEKGTFDKENLPVGLKYWLDQYSNEITNIRKNSHNAANQLAEISHSDIEIRPMLKTTWDQNSPYNKYCVLKTDDGTTIQCVAGSVAVAMAQVMNYYRYPETGTGSVKYKIYSNVPELSMDFSAVKFDWDNMLDDYSGKYEENELNAVATLIEACGYAVVTKFGQLGSSASIDNIRKALVQYFKYDSSSSFISKNFYNSSEWENLLIENLKNGPLIYTGQGMTEGLAFVCDGYDGNGYFHFNWGDSGIGDGYFLVNYLNPESNGNEYFAGGYEINQTVIVPVIDNNNKLTNPVIQYGSLKGELNKNLLTLSLVAESGNRGWSYTGYSKTTVDYGVIVEDMSNNQEIQYFTCINGKELENGIISLFLVSLDLNYLQMTNGDRYKLTLVTKPSSSENNDSWEPILTQFGCSNYVFIEKDESGYSVINPSPSDLKVSELENLTELYFQSPIEFKAIFQNDSDEDITQNLSAAFVDDKNNLVYVTQNIMVDVAANSVLEKRWISNGWYASEKAPSTFDMDTEYFLKLYNNDTRQIVKMDGVRVTLKPAPPKPEYKVELSISESNQENGVYILSGVKEVPVEFNIELKSGYYDSVVELAIFEVSEDTGDYTMRKVFSSYFPEIVILNNPESSVFKTTLNFTEADSGQLYLISLNDRYHLVADSCYFKFDESEHPEGNVRMIAPDDNGLYIVYDINGNKILETETFSDLRELNKGIYIINGNKMVVK